MLVDARQDEAPLVEGLRSLGRGPDAHGRERMPHTREEAALLWKGPAVAHNGKRVHLEAVVVMEAEGLMPDDPPVKPESARFKALP